METFILRFPTVTQKIFSVLDNQSLVTSKIVDMCWYNYINDSIDHSHRLIVSIIRKRNLLRKIWLEVVKKTNKNTRKEIAISFIQFSLKHNNEKFVEWNIPKVCYPFNVAVASGKMDLCDHVIDKLGLNKILHSDECTTDSSLLLEFIRSEKYRLPLLMTAYKGHNEIFKMLYHHIAAKMGHAYVTKLCIETVTNYKNISGVTPIFEAAKYGSLEIYKIMTDKLENKNPTCNQENCTPLHMAALKNHIELFEFIIQNVTKKNPNDNFGTTPLHYAAEKGHLKICKLIIDDVEEINPKDNVGTTPLLLATENGNLEVCKLIINSLVEKNPKYKRHMILGEKNPKDSYGITPLHNGSRWKTLIFLALALQFLLNYFFPHAFPLHEDLIYSLLWLHSYF